MKKIVSTIVLAMTLIGGVLVAPATAADQAAPATCEALLGESQYREGLLHDQIAAYRTITDVVAKDLRRAERKIERQRATIKRLRAQIAATR